MAYFLLPQYVFENTEAVLKALAGDETPGAGFYYVMTCAANGKEPRPELIRSFPVHCGTLDDHRRYTVVQYPSPPPVGVSAFDQAMAALENVVLAPYFSAIIENTDSKEIHYFILGQSPVGSTTLRGVRPGMNANLGEGCEPELDQFIELLRNV
jgi:hypothetical protein